MTLAGGVGWWSTPLPSSTAWVQGYTLPHANRKVCISAPLASLPVGACVPI